MYAVSYTETLCFVTFLWYHAGAFMFDTLIAHAAEEGGIHIALSPYVIGHIAGIPVTATLLTATLVALCLIVAGYWWGRSLNERPSKFQVLLELLVGGLYEYVESTLESRALARKYFPIIITIFVFILAMNWVGLLPGVTSIGFFEGHGEEQHFIPLLYPAATDLNITIAFALIAMAVIEYAGVTALGAFTYIGKFINFSSPLNFVVGLIELVSELGRLVSFSFRLFGNIFAGKTLLVVAMFFVPLVLPVPILAYEVFVGFIQAAVFAFLTLIFIKLATAHH